MNQSELLNYFEGDELAANVFLNKYAQEGDKTPDDMHKRMAKEFNRIEENYYSIESYAKHQNGKLKLLSNYGQSREDLTEDSVYNLFKDFKYIIPQGSIMSQLGSKSIGSLSNCFVVGQPDDSYGGIFMKDEEMAQLMKRRGGVGIDISKLRPVGTLTSNAAKTSTGAISFMHRFSNTTREVAQNGRRGALMISIDINHPDVMEFIKIKRDLTQVTGANISIKLNKEFMEAVEKDEDYILRFPCTHKFSFELSKPELPDYDNHVKDLDYNELVDVALVENQVIFAKKIRAKEYWDEIIKSAHNVAEPGLIFWDNMIEYSPDGVYEQFRAVTTNPCCFSETCRVDVITDKGIKDIRKVTDKDLVWLQNESKFVPTKGYTNYGRTHTYKVEFTNGDNFIVTPNHRFGRILPKRVGTKVNKDNFELVQLSDLKVGDEIRIHNEESLSFGNLGTKEEGYLLGWLSGDGCLSYRNEGDNFPTMYLDFWEKEHDIAVKMLEIVNQLGFNNILLEFKNNGNDVKRIASSRLTQYFTEKYEANIWKYKRGRNEFLYSASRDFVKGYLAGYFTADGTIQNVVEQSRYSISLSSIDKDRLYQVQSLLLNFGIKSSIGLSREEGEYTNYSYENSQDCYRLTITGISNIKKFHKHIGFLNSYKQDKLEELYELELEYEKSLSFTKIKSIEYHGVEEVGCIEVPNYHYFTANTIISGNSEIAMQPYDACRLIAVNLFSFVDNPFTKKAIFNFEKFYEVNYEAMRLSDNLIDLELENINRIIKKIESDPEDEGLKLRELKLWSKIKETARSSRRTGLGFTALADTLAALGLKYDSDKALNIIENIMDYKMQSELDCTIDLAILRGTFEGWDKNKEITLINAHGTTTQDAFEGSDSFYKMVIQRFPEQSQRMWLYGRRNVSWSTVAPTGTVSIMTRTTSGIEPLFLPYYIRRKKVNPGEDVRVDFVDQNGDSWQEFPVLHPKFKDWYNQYYYGIEELVEVDNATKDTLQRAFELSPWYQSTANDIDWSKRVEIQSIIQKYITHSISSTINLPSDVSEKEVSKIYMESWKKGLKGITVYRDGSRSGVLVSETKPKQDRFGYTEAPKRPKELEADYYFTTSKGEEFAVIVGLLEDKPYEVFAFKSPLSKEHLKGTLVKNRRGHYSFISSNYTIENLELSAENADEKLLTRWASLLLRHGANPKFVVEQTEKSEIQVTSFTKVLTRILKKYIPDGEKSTVSCEECGSENVVFEEGCRSCKSCGHSKCG